ncbi:DUF2283 domain-containing protein [Nocardia takedensis]
MNAANPVKVTVDYNAGAAYIELSDNPVAETIEVTPDIQVDVDELGVAVGVELLSLTANIPITEMAKRFHFHSGVVDSIRQIRPSVHSFVASFSSQGGSSAAVLGSVQQDRGVDA